MALTYEQVLEVIHKSPDRRKDFEVSNLLSWFRKKSQLFASLKTELLFDIIKNLQFVTKKQDELIIRQGDKGDCMYILLRGQVTIYIWYSKMDTSDDDQLDGLVPLAGSTGNIRQQLGTVVTSLGPGATFGEVALRQEDDCIRTASIIADETCDLIVVDRELYNRSVKYVLKKEFDDKLSFVLHHPVLRYWAPRYRKQLAMALEKHVYPYESHVTRQGDHVNAIYFVLHGEVKLTVDKEQLKTQYPKYFSEDGRALWHDDLDPDKDADLTWTHTKGREKQDGHNGKGLSKGKQSKKKSTVDICFIGSNEPIGDLEILQNLDSFCQTAIATQRTDVLILERKHYDRLVVKRNPNTVHLMRQSLELRLRQRMTRFVEANVGLMKRLLQQVEAANEHRRQQHEMQQARLAARQQQQQQQQMQMAGATTVSTAATGEGGGDPLLQAMQQENQDSFGDEVAKFIPNRGALIDIYGPGTVFHWIRKNAGPRRSQYGKSALGLLDNGGGNGTVTQTSLTKITESPPPPGRGGAADNRYTDNSGHSHYSFHSSGTSLPDLTVRQSVLLEDKIGLIESRIHQWMMNGTLQGSSLRARVAPLPRLVAIN